MKKFNFKKEYEEVEIEGKVYRINFDDASILEYHKEFEDFYKDVERVQAIDTTDMDNAQLKEVFKDIRKISQPMMDSVLGAGSFNELYEKSGRSTMKMVDALNFVSDIVGDGMTEVRNKRKNNYTKKSV